MASWMRCPASSPQTSLTTSRSQSCRHPAFGEESAQGPALRSRSWRSSTQHPVCPDLCLLQGPQVGTRVPAGVPSMPSWWPIDNPWCQGVIAACTSCSRGKYSHHPPAALLNPLPSHGALGYTSWWTWGTFWSSMCFGCMAPLQIRSPTTANLPSGCRGPSVQPSAQRWASPPATTPSQTARWSTPTKAWRVHWGVWLHAIPRCGVPDCHGWSMLTTPRCQRLWEWGFTAVPVVPVRPPGVGGCRPVHPDQHPPLQSSLEVGVWGSSAFFCPGPEVSKPPGGACWMGGTVRFQPPGPSCVCCLLCSPQGAPTPCPQPWSRTCYWSAHQ